MVTVRLNAVERRLPAGSAVDAAVALVARDPTARGIAVAVNGEVVPRTAWERTALCDGDDVEVLTAVQGG